NSRVISGDFAVHDTPVLQHKAVSSAGHEQTNDRSGRIDVPGNRGAGTYDERRKNTVVDNEGTLVRLKNLSSEPPAAWRAAVGHTRIVVERRIALPAEELLVCLAGIRRAVHAVHGVAVVITTK